MVNTIIFSDVSNYDGFGRNAGPYRIATELRKHNYSCQVIDWFSYLNETQIVKILEKIVDKDTLWVGFSTTFFRNKTITLMAHEQGNLTNWCHDYNLFETIKNVIKELNPNTKIIIAGAKASWWDKTPIIGDYHIIGYGDKLTIELTNHLKCNKELSSDWKQHDNGLKYVINLSDNTGFDFNRCQIIWHETDFIYHGEVLPLEVARGCIFKCSFCSFLMNGKTKLDYIKDLDILGEELERNWNQYGVSEYYLTDDTYNDSVEKLKSLYSVYRQMPFDFKFTSYLRLDLIERWPEQVELLKKSGLQSTIFGIETFSDLAGKLIGKGQGKARILKTLEILEKEWGDDIIRTSGFIIGLPGETEAEIMETAKWLLSGQKLLHGWSIEPLMLNPNKMNKNLIEENPSKYGVTLYDDGSWKHENMSSTRAQQLSILLNKIQPKKKVFGGFSYPRMRNLGLTKFELNNPQTQEFYTKLKYSKFYEYLNSLANFYNLELF